MELKWKVAALVSVLGICLFLFTENGKPLDVQSSSVTGHSYVAAVVEFSPKGRLSNVTTADVEENLKSYGNFVAEARSQEADIIIFPEYGLTTISPYNQRDLALELSQVVPAPGENMSPCDSDNEEEDFRVTKKLSCLAKENGIYLVVNLLQKVMQDNKPLLYNTDAVFDRNGKIIARYRKFHLFGEIALNETEIPDITTFDTDFGMTFGVITCFDLMFRTPAVDLVRRQLVDGIVFPTAWFSELPFLTASQAQAAWSAGMQVDLLASGFNNPVVGSTGSGVYQKGKFYTTMMSSEGNKILVSRVGAGSAETKLETKCGFKTLEEDLSKYTAKALTVSNQPQKETVCSSELCCQVNYRINSNGLNHRNIHFQILVFSGERIHANIYKSKMQVCAVVACASSEKQSCAHNFDKSKYSTNVLFSSLEISGNFSNDAVLPNTLNSHNCGPLKPEEFNFSSQNTFYSIRARQPSSGIHTFGLYSHGF
ncbi:vanin-like protein 2 [Neocloeon triangulifer]|uniref:vanin-like protein 2 n=1 Tax=Neocloeon triangulifer TaxID=2078957 RepID=UPI00286F378F|nr:vanin-like protein 2 [Neocloeon triangulifer]